MDAGSDVNARGHKGDSPLHLAAEDGKKDLCLLLISKGADLYALNNDNKTALDLCRKNLENNGFNDEEKEEILEENQSAFFYIIAVAIVKMLHILNS